MTEELQRLIDSLAPALAAVFIAAIATLRAGINFPRLLSALRSGDTDAAIDALNIERGVFSGYVLERQTSFAGAGAEVSRLLTDERVAFFRDSSPEARRRRAPETAPTGPSRPRPPAPPVPSLEGPEPSSIQFRFDMTNPRAEARIRTEAATRVAGYVDEQIETARRVIADGFRLGQGPQTIATDIAGRINPISGRREGGIVGLSDPQAGYVESMRARLLSGDPDEMMKVLGSFDGDGKWKPGTGMTLRDRRFDRSIMKAIRDVAAGKPNPLTRDRVDEMTAKYSDRLLTRRAEDIARTETAQGVMMARAEATQQALTKVGLDDQAVTKGWRHLGGPDDARNWHLAMHGKTVIGLTVPFLLPDGSIMQHSHDPAGGVRNNANCRCGTDFDIDWAYGL